MMLSPPSRCLGTSTIMTNPTRVMGVKPTYSSSPDTEGQTMSDETVWVVIDGERGAFWEKHPAHPHGEVFVRGGGPSVEVARTQKVHLALAGHLKQVKAPEDDAVAEAIAVADTTVDEDTVGAKDLADNPARKPIETGEHDAVPTVRKEAVTPRRRGRPAGTRKTE